MRVRYAHRARLARPTPASELIGFLRNFERNAFVEALSSYAVQRYRREPDTSTFEGDEPWVVAGVAALALSRAYPTGRVPTRDDIRKACGLYFNLERPRDPRHELSLERFLFPELYRQGAYQRWLLGDVARASVMLHESSWAAPSGPAVMGAGWEYELLGCSVQEFLAAGFLLFGATVAGWRYPFQADGSMSNVFDAFGGQDRFDAIVSGQYIANVQTFRKERRAAVERQREFYDQPWVAEPFAFNPLIRRPLLEGVVAEAAIAPAPEEIVRRSSVEGIIYEGLALHGGSFTADIGHYFEGYVGRQLQLSGAKVFGEVALAGKAGARATVDWFVDLGDSIILVECKSALPRRDVVEGWGSFADGHLQVIKGREQIVRTFDDIKNGRPELAFLSSDVPVVGLVVTLGSFHAGNDEIVVGVSERRDVPTGVVDAELIEALVTLPLEDLRKFVRRVLGSAEVGSVEPRDLCTGLNFRPNSLLEEAFDGLPVLSSLPSTADR